MQAQGVHDGKYQLLQTKYLHGKAAALCKSHDMSAYHERVLENVFEFEASSDDGSEI